VRLVVWGAGELGSRVATGWQAGSVVGLTRTAKRHATLNAAGVDARIGSAVGLLHAGDALLLAIPGHVAQGEAIAALSDTSPPRRAVLISSTGYYGMGLSGVVDEGTPPGDSDRSHAIAATERSFLDWAGRSGVVFRCGGLYRPGRGPFSAFARSHQVPPRPPDGKMALIHYEDVATATLAALSLPDAESVYLVLTPPCPTRRAFYEAASRVLRLSAPSLVSPRGLPPAEYDVSRLRRDLLPQAAYPDWRAALC
jgi:nucleoside-diphosphate-sugar epimerase